MDRRKFIRQSALALPSAFFLAQLLDSCKKEELTGVQKYSGKVTIIGAGIAGLYAAYMLKQYNVDVRIIEASNNFGGRIKSNSTFADFPIELGAEKIRGSQSLWYDVVRSSEAEIVSSEKENYYFVQGHLKSETELSSASDFNEMQNAIQDLSTYTGGSVSAHEYAVALGISERMLPVFDALVGNSNGTSAANIGALGLSYARQSWTAGYDEYVLKNRSLSEVIAEKFASVLSLIEYNKAIVNVDTSGDRIVLTDNSGGTSSCDKVVVTVPFFQMQHNDFTFTPNLPSIFRQSINAAGYDNAGMKIVLKFSSSFWPANTGSLYTSGYVPEYYPTGAGVIPTSYHLLTAFVMGDRAQTLSSMGDGMIPAILADLDLIFGGTTASGSYLEHLVQDWGATPYINGAMSYPKIGTVDTREVFNVPVLKKIYFAGEATCSTGQFGTVHGALETGLRAANLILTGQ